MKKQLNLRVSDLTIGQLDWLTKKWNTSRTETITLIIDRACQEERNLPATSDILSTRQFNHSTKEQRTMGTERTFKLKDTSPDTMETLRQADAFSKMAQEEERPIQERRAYLEMANSRYSKIYVETLVEVHPNPPGSSGTFELPLTGSSQ